MNKILVLAAFLPILTVTGCLHGDGAATYEKPARFLSGVWHGWLCWLTLIIGVFNHNIRIYETVDSGWWYDLGYLTWCKYNRKQWVCNQAKSPLS